MSVPQVQITARDYYVLTRGISLEAAISLVAVLYYESKLNPGSQGYQSTETPGVLNPHGAYGIASWNGPRQQDLLNFATEHSLQVAALDTQLAFVLTEIANGYPSSWSAVRSPASYHAIIPIIVDEYENPKNKTAETNGALAIAGPLAALPPPVPALPPAAAPIPQPPMAVPQDPAIIPPASQPPMPAAPAGPISAATAGRQAAILDNLGAMRAAYLAEIAAAQKELAILETTIASFSTLQGVTPIPPLLLPTSSSQPAETNQGTTPMPSFLLNWKTTLSGIVMAAGALSTQFPQLAPYANVITAIGGLALGLVAKDSNVSGGTKSAVTGVSVARPVSLIDGQ